MKKHLLLLGLSIIAFNIGGCVVEDPRMYDACKSDKDCTGTFVTSYCEALSVEYYGGPIDESLCTETCSSSCSTLSRNGEFAYCADIDSYGYFTTDSTYTVYSICVESCDVDTDCSSGFICGDDNLVDVPDGVNICIPGTAAAYQETLKEDPYNYCVADSECSTAANDCLDISAKWIEETETYSENICSLICDDKLDCPSIAVGTAIYEGECLAAGVVSSEAVCAQACDYDSDCLDGFDCADSKELVGLADDVSVCVPH